MSPPNRETQPYKRQHAGSRHWKQGDDFEDAEPPRNKRGKYSVPDKGTIVKLTFEPEAHTLTDSGDLIIGSSRSVRGHAGATFRSGGAHTHGLNEEGDRVHIPAKGHSTSDKNGPRQARKQAHSFRAARNGIRK